MDEAGTIVIARFDPLVAEQQMVKANVLRRRRLWTEEQDHQDSRGVAPRSSTEQTSDPAAMPEGRVRARSKREE